MAEYQQKNVDRINEDISKEFDKIKKIDTRSDKEIYAAGKNVIEKYIDEIRDRSPSAIKPFQDLQQKYITE